MTRHPRAAQLFAVDTREHEMTVLHEDGVYRHIRFRNPVSSIAWYDLVTWPGCLTIHGDMGTFTFARITDMTRFFTGSDINPGYWGEKVQGDQREEIRRYSEDLFRQYVTEAFRAYADTHGWVFTEVSALWSEISEEILGSLDFTTEDESAARAAVERFTWASNLDDEEVPELPVFRFTDSWEWDTRDFTHRFLWCCFAVQHGVNRYLAARVEAADPEAVAASATTVRPPVPAPNPHARPAVLTLQPRGDLL